MLAGCLLDALIYLVKLTLLLWNSDGDMSFSTLCFIRVPTAQGKQGQSHKKFPVRRNTGNLEILPKHRENTGNFFAQVVNSLILKVKESVIFVAEFSIFFPEAG